MSDMIVNDSIFRRIEKLLAIQEANGSSEGEIANATAAVQRLLEQHNLTLSDVERRGGAGDQAQRTKDNSLIASPYQPWRAKLMKGVGRNNFCLVRSQAFRDGQKKRQRLLVVGREINVRSAKLTYGYVAEAMIRAMMAQGYRLTDKTGYSREGNAFLEGATSRIVARLDEMRQEREEQSKRDAQARQGNGSGTELVLSDVYGSEADLNNDALNGYPQGTTAARRREQAAREVTQQAEHDRLVAAGVNSTEAWYRAMGYSAEAAQRYTASYEKANRRSQRGGGRAGRAQNFSRSDRAHHEMVASPAYKAGREAGATIGLDVQVGADTVKRLK